MKTITILAYNRPQYLAQCLEALAQCRGVKDYGILISVDGGGSQVELPLGLDAEVCYLPMSYGIDEHNFVCYDAVFENGKGHIDFNIALEDDVILSPDALELADWFYRHPDREQYAYMSLGDPHYRKGPPLEHEYRDVRECRALYTSAWCFSITQWAWMRQFWNRPLRTQLGWDWSIAFSLEEQKWRSLYPLVSRARNIGREGVHSYPEFFDANVAGSRASDGRALPEMEITYRMDEEPVPEWIVKELAAKEDRYVQLRNR